MASKTPEGNFIISASEVGAFTLCPEAWRLKEIARVKVEPSARALEGSKMHRDWALRQEELLYLLHRVRFVLWLVLGAGLVMLLK